MRKKKVKSDYRFSKGLCTLMYVGPTLFLGAFVRYGRVRRKILVDPCSLSLYTRGTIAVSWALIRQ